MCEVDLEPAEVWTEILRRARKEHQCCECYHKIVKGTRYVWIDWLSDGRWSSEQAHKDCLDLKRKIANDYCDGSYSLGNLYDWVVDHVEYDPKLRKVYSVLLARRAKEAKRVNHDGVRDGE